MKDKILFSMTVTMLAGALIVCMTAMVSALVVTPKPETVQSGDLFTVSPAQVFDGKSLWLVTHKDTGTRYVVTSQSTGLAIAPLTEPQPK